MLAAGQHGLFGIFDDHARCIARRQMRCLMCRTGTRISVCKSEKEVLGFFVSGHPLDKYAEKLRNMNVVDTQTALGDEACAIEWTSRAAAGEP